MQVTPYTGLHPAARGPGRYHLDMAETSAPEALAAALDRIGDRWTPQVVAALLDGPRRYGELSAAIPGLAPNILAERLRRLERDGLLVASPYAERPTRFEYRLTAVGRDLAGAIRLITDWGRRHVDPGGPGADAIRHDACGTPLEARWYCPTCTRVAAPGDIDAPQRL